MNRIGRESHLITKFPGSAHKRNAHGPAETQFRTKNSTGGGKWFFFRRMEWLAWTHRMIRSRQCQYVTSAREFFRGK